MMPVDFAESKLDTLQSLPHNQSNDLTLRNPSTITLTTISNSVDLAEDEDGTLF
jgi:hypothetical protein